MSSVKLADRPTGDLPPAYESSADPAVRAFLAKAAFVYPLLSDIANEARRHFPVSRLSLSVARDPEAIDRDQLVVNIHVSLPPAEALNCLSTFDRDWWLSNVDRAHGMVIVDIAPE